jgi:hypothetical protein
MLIVLIKTLIIMSLIIDFVHLIVVSEKYGLFEFPRHFHRPLSEKIISIPDSQTSTWLQINNKQKQILEVLFLLFEEIKIIFSQLLSKKSEIL